MNPRVRVLMAIVDLFSRLDDSEDAPFGEYPDVAYDADDMLVTICGNGRAALIRIEMGRS